MKINHNDSAVITNVKLLRNENFLTASMERLSSGFKINHAVDNPSGMAISNKMQAQINALNQASRNSSDGLSVLDTADGALHELTSILQRIRELAVQAANDTNSNSDRDACQVEIDQLTAEIDRIAESSEFNTKSLLDGSLDAHVYGENTTRRYMSDAVMPGIYSLEITEAATQSTMDLITAGVPAVITEAEAGYININGSIVDIKVGMTKDEVEGAIKKGAERADITFDIDNSIIKTDEYGVDSSLKISASAEVAAMLGIGETVEENNANVTEGHDATIELDKADSAFKDHLQARISQKDNKITITDANGFEMSFKVRNDEEWSTGKIDLEVTDLGPMDIQVGANARQQIAVRIPSVSVEDMYLDKVNVRTFETASKAIGSLDDAISYINKARAKIGSYANRLEHTVSSTDNTEENMTAAISRIKDVDMAQEMTEYTKQNVLVQAATSALSQANEIPQMALQLLS